MQQTRFQGHGDPGSGALDPSEHELLPVVPARDDPERGPSAHCALPACTPRTTGAGTQARPHVSHRQVRLEQPGPVRSGPTTVHGQVVVGVQAVVGGDVGVSAVMVVANRRAATGMVTCRRQGTGGSGGGA